MCIDMSLYTTNFIEFNTTDLGNVMKNKTSSTLNFPSNTTTVNKQQIVYPNPTMIKETDIVAQMNGYPLYGDQVFTFGPRVQNQYVIMGYATNGALYSNDGINWNPLGTYPIGSNTASGVFWDGTKWFGVVHTYKLYSYDGTNWTVIGPNIIFSGGWGGWNAYYNGIIYLLVGNSGSNNTNLYYSYDGLNWTSSATQPGETMWCVKWNGFVWLMSTSNYLISFMYSYDGITWTSIVNSISNTTGLLYPYDVAWIGDKWVAIGAGASGSNIAYIIYTNDYTGSTGWTVANSTIFTPATSLRLVWNGIILVAVGYGPTNSLAYSYDGKNWFPNGKTVFMSISAIPNVSTGIWDGVKYVLTGSLDASGNGNTIAYSNNGINVVGLGSSLIRSPYTLGYNTIRPHSITFQKRLTIALGSGTGNTIAYSLDGINWNGLGTTIFSTQGLSTAYNGKIWVAGGQGTNTLALSKDGYTWSGLGTSIFSTCCCGVTWSNTLSIWVATGRGTNTLAYSYDGMTWLKSSTSNIIENTGGGNCVIWTGKLFIAGGGNTSGNTLAYSSNGINWTGILAANGINITVRTLATNGSIVVAGGDIGYFYYSYNGIQWTNVSIPLMNSVKGIAWNGNMFVAVGAGTRTSYYSYDGINWIGGTTTFATTGLGICWNGTVWTAVGQGTNTLTYSPNGLTWTGITGTGIFSTSGNCIASNYQVPPQPYIQHPTIAMSSSTTTNTIHYSLDGLSWKPVPNSVFSVQGNKAFWSGSSWVAVGAGGNCISYSYDGINWTGVNQTIFNGTLGGQGICYNGKIWVAVGQGSNTIAYSTNGTQWTPVTNSSQIFTNYGDSVAWNGVSFVATGAGSNTIATSTNGITWQGSVTGTTFTTNGAGLWSNGPLWVATGTGSDSIVYTTDTTGRTGWTATGVNPFSTGGNDIAWNGIIWVASGTGTANTVATSPDGTTWTGQGLVVPTAGGGVCWNGVRWILTSNSSTPGNIVYSQNGTTWYSTGYTITNSMGVTSNPGVGAFVAPSALFLDNNGITGNGIASSQTLDVISSDPYYQQGYDNVSITVNPTYNPSLMKL